ncbi:LysR family transcriptional regulator [Sphingomonas gei]|uniref:LysR family transcriptional regulator n=1 Tax=Sphingomonas gei TaxID=1395960 RepID=A0A4S1XFZ9_9SPHN|nr:LysR family transcriptional regulator [Sphingomonas gei]TGX54905.1 LysR family transcriptional regulator [Sphingomonas gei]
MAKEPNRAAEMAVFVRVVETGDFSGAARALGLSPSAVSKLVARLEARLGTRLLRRSTRRLALTAEGEAFHARAAAILADIDAAEREAGGARLPAGRVRVASSASYVAHVLAPLLPDFLARYPDIGVDILQSDAISDLVADRTDLAIRAGPLRDSSLIARSLGETPLIVAAAPSWIARHGMPATPEDLAAHDRLGFSYPRAAGDWLRPGRNEVDRVRVNDGEGIRQLALAGVAPARLAGFTIHDDLAAGRLVALLPDRLPPASEVFHAIYVGRSENLPQRVQVLLDELTLRGSVGYRNQSLP